MAHAGEINANGLISKKIKKQTGCITSFQLYLHEFHPLFHGFPWIVPWISVARGSQGSAQGAAQGAAWATASDPAAVRLRLLQQLAVQGVAQQRLVEGVDLLGEVGLLATIDTTIDTRSSEVLTETPLEEC